MYRPGLGIVCCILFAGCLVPGHEEGPHEHEFEIVEWRQATTVLVLEYTLTNLGSETRAADPGGHCGHAWMDDGHVEVQRHAIERAGPGGAYLFVDPWMKGAWAAWGDGPLFFALPATVDAGIPGEVAWAHVSLANGTASVDGMPVDLPHHWHLEDEDAQWRIDARLTPGPRDIGVIEDVLCE